MTTLDRLVMVGMNQHQARMLCVVLDDLDRGGWAWAVLEPVRRSVMDGLVSTENVIRPVGVDGEERQA